MIRFGRKQWIIGCCAAAMLLMSAAGSLLMAVQTRMIFAADDSVKALSEAYNSSGQELFSRLAASPGNIVFSPYSVGTAMALALSGSRGETEAEMARVLKHRLLRTEIDGANGKALAVLGQYGRQPFPWTSGAAKLMTANAVMLTDRSGMISKDYLAGMKANYAAEIFRNADLGVVNDWVSRKTEGKIEKIIDKLDPRTVTVLVNAIYFKASWESPFDSRNTRTEEFEISPWQKVPVPIMHREGDYQIVAEQRYSAIRLPYQIPRLHMVIVLPHRVGGLDMVGARLDGAELSRLFAQLHGPAQRISLALPRFKTSFNVKLKHHFQALGMTRPFDSARADFSGMTGGSAAENEIFIDDVSHRAVIDVTEEGTEAAAATAAFMIASSPPQFRVTRPFLFYIVDDATDAILFQGRIVDPR
jgi:leukocyte elastase inhibitor